MLASRLLLLAAGLFMSVPSAITAEPAADPRDELAQEIKSEIVTQRYECFEPSYMSRQPCGTNTVCHPTVDAITDFQLGLGDPETQKSAVYKWWRFVSGSLAKSSCMQELLSGGTYCKAVNLVNKFDPHTKCPTEGGTSATCWVNREWERSPLLLGAEEGDWLQKCELTE